MARLSAAVLPAKFSTRWSLALWVCLLAALAGCGSAPATPSTTSTAGQDAETLTQVSTYPALQMGQFNGDVTYAQLEQGGDFGLGTFNSLDGEMVALDGVFYQAKSDGSVVVADKSLKTPFADVHFFHSNQQVQLKEPLQNLDQLKAYLAKQLPSPNRPYGIKISGTFPTLKWRSVPKQQEPYPPLAEAVNHQVVFEQQNMQGTLVGYALPQYLSGIAATGFHFHFVSADKLHGGHVLDISLNEATVDIDFLESIKLLIPQNATFQQTNFSQPQN